MSLFQQPYQTYSSVVKLPSFCWINAWLCALKYYALRWLCTSKVFICVAIVHKKWSSNDFSLQNESKSIKVLSLQFSNHNPTSFQNKNVFRESIVYFLSYRHPVWTHSLLFSVFFLDLSFSLLLNSPFSKIFVSKIVIASYF